MTVKIESTHTIVLAHKVHTGYFIWKRRVETGGHFVLTLTHWGRKTHICVGKLTIIGSNNGLSPGRRQAIIWNNAGLM